MGIPWPVTGAAALLALSAIGGCGAGSSAPSPAPSSRGSASATTETSAAERSAADAVTGYLTAIGDHDAAIARRYLSPEFARAFGTTADFDAWVANHETVRILGVQPPRTPAADVAEQHPGYREFVQYPVSYQAVLKHATANEVSGQLDRFVLVGRTSSTSPWLILDVATSP